MTATTWTAGEATPTSGRDRSQTLLAHRPKRHQYLMASAAQQVKATACGAGSRKRLADVSKWHFGAVPAAQPHCPSASRLRFSALLSHQDARRLLRCRDGLRDVANRPRDGQEVAGNAGDCLRRILHVLGQVPRNRALFLHGGRGNDDSFMHCFDNALNGIERLSRLAGYGLVWTPPISPAICSVARAAWPARLFTSRARSGSPKSGRRPCAASATRRFAARCRSWSLPSLRRWQACAKKLPRRSVKSPTRRRGWGWRGS